MKDPKEEESMDSILSSIRHMVYPKAADHSATVIDLTRPVQEEDRSLLPGVEEAACALSSFQEAVRSRCYVSENQPPQAEKMDETKKTLEEFIKDLVLSGLAEPMKVISSQVIVEEVRCLFPVILEKWIEKNLSKIVVECVEKKLEDMQKKNRASF